MRIKALFLIILIIGIGGFFANGAFVSNAQTDNKKIEGSEWEEIVEHTRREEQAGRELWEKMKAKEIECPDLNDDQFASLGEYFMGQMTGESHASMNAMMLQMHGEEGEEQMHQIMGKRLSGCDTFAGSAIGNTFGMMNMMSMMGGWSSPFGLNTNSMMMNFGFWPFAGFGILMMVLMILWWILIIVGIIALVRWIARTSAGAGPRGHERSALDILKERYAKGEIDKKEFEERKRDLS